MISMLPFRVFIPGCTGNQRDQHAQQALSRVARIYGAEKQAQPGGKKHKQHMPSRFSAEKRQHKRKKHHKIRHCKIKQYRPVHTVQQSTQQMRKK